MNLVVDLLQSLVDTTLSPRRVEVLIVYDADDRSVDPATIQNSFPLLNVKLLRRNRSNHLNQDYINYAAGKSTGKYLFVLNDDIQFVTPEWDRLAKDALDAYTLMNNDRIVYGMIDDSMMEVRKSQKLQYCGFPIISREAFNALGYAMHPAFNAWGADIHLFQVYQAVNRVLDLSFIRLLHISHHTQRRPRDQLNVHVQAITNHVNPDIGPDAARLRQVMNPTMPVPPAKIVLPPKPVLSGAVAAARRRRNALRKTQ